MSTIFNDAKVQIVVADFANTDAIGKLNIIGAGALMLMQPAPSVWPAISVAITVDVPAKHAGEEFALLVELHDITTGARLRVPGPDGTMQPLRVQQAVTVAPITVPPQFKRPEDVYVQHVMALNFPTGIPLTPGSTYEWRVQIDGQTSKHWTRRFHALGPAAGLVFGGPEGSPTIPGVTPDAGEPEE